jgi:soluble lytic murein transglycosylase-like protein
MNGGKGLAKALLVLAVLLLAPAAVAGTVYRCEGKDGVRSYSSKRVPGAACTAVSTYSESRSRRGSAPATAPAPAAAGAVTAAATQGTATTATATATPAGAGTSSPRKVRFVRMGASTTYSYVDANGVRNYSNRRPKGVANVSVSRVQYPIFEMDTCYACGVQPKVNFGNVRLNTSAYQAEIAAAARDFGVEEAVVRAIIHAESAYRPNALSRVGAQGLMQLMPATARRFGVSNAFDAGQNIRGGVQYLSWLLKRFNGNLTLAAAGYNAGEGAVDRHKGVPPYSETRRYVERVGMLADRYRATLRTQ